MRCVGAVSQLLWWKMKTQLQRDEADGSDANFSQLVDSYLERLGWRNCVSWCSKE